MKKDYILVVNILQNWQTWNTASADLLSGLSSGQTWLPGRTKARSPGWVNLPGLFVGL
jgi:hypothetical protein